MWHAAMWGGISGSAVLLGALASMFFDSQTDHRLYYGFWHRRLNYAPLTSFLEMQWQKAELCRQAPDLLRGSRFTIFDYAVSKRGASQRKRSGQARRRRNRHFYRHHHGCCSGIDYDWRQPSRRTIGQLPLVFAIFISNIPEGLSSTAGMKNSGYSRTKIMPLWCSVRDFDSRIMVRIFLSRRRF